MQNSEQLTFLSVYFFVKTIMTGRCHCSFSTAQKKLSFLEGSDEESLSESEEEDNDHLSGITDFDEVVYPENRGDGAEFPDFSDDAADDFMDDGSGQHSMGSNSELSTSMSIESQILVQSLQAKIKSIGKMVRYLSLCCA